MKLPLELGLYLEEEARTQGYNASQVCRQAVRYFRLARKKKSYGQLQDEIVNGEREMGLIPKVKKKKRVISKGEGHSGVVAGIKSGIGPPLAT